MTNPVPDGPSRLLNSFLTLWLLGSLVSAIIQLAFPERFAGGANWGHAPGWQREIGFWNVGMAALISQVIRRGSVNAKVAVAGALVLLSVFLGTNHAAEVIQGQKDFHFLGMAVNYIGVIYGTGALLASARDRRSGQT